MRDATANFSADAFWIGSNHAFDLQEAYLCFRSPADFTLDQTPQQAILHITADSRYKLWINGRFVARGPNRCYPDYQIVDALDVAQFLRPGRNVIAAQVYSPGYSHFSYVHRGAAGLLAQLTGDGQPILASNARWRTLRDPSYDPIVPRVSIYGTGVERRDLNKEDAWRAPAYDDSHWETPRVFAPVNGDPWVRTLARELPLLVERTWRPALVEARHGPTVVNADPHLALAAGWPAAEPLASRTLERPLAAGESLYLLTDLGRDYTCQGAIAITGAAGGETVAISYAEKIRDGALVISDPRTYCRVRLTDHFTLRPGSQTAEGFTQRGGRYLLFQIDGPTGPDFRFAPAVTVSEYPLSIMRPLEMTDPRLKAIGELCERTFRACLQDGFVDSTWRESSQWLGDALPQSLIMAALSDDVGPLRQVLAMAVQGRYPDGTLPSVLPGEVHAYAVVDYNFTWVELLELYARLTEDQAFVDVMWPALVAMLNSFDQQVAADGLLRGAPGRRLFLDWSPVARGEPNAIYNLRYLQGLQAAVCLAGARAERAADATIWSERARRLQATLRDRFWHDSRWYDDPARTTFSQQSAALALLSGTAVAGSEPALLDAIVARSLDLNDDHTPGEMVLASPFMHHYILEALRHFERYDDALEVIRRRWGRWIDQGCPTTWENWNVDFPDGSQCHAFSAHPRYHLAEIVKAIGPL